MIIKSGYWKGWEVFIGDKDGKPLPEYLPEHHKATPEQCEMTKVYIQCQQEQEFAIYVRPPGGGRYPWDLLAEHIIDGRPIQNTFLSRPSTYGSTPGIRYWYDIVDGVKMRKNLKFSKLTMSEDGDVITPGVAQKLGTIVEKLTRLLPGSKPYLGEYHTSEPPKSNLHETVKKGRLDTYVGGDVVSQAPSRATLYRFVKNPKAPVYGIEFIYGTRETLMAEGVIERPMLNGEKNVGHKDLKVPAPGSAPSKRILHNPCTATSKRSRSATLEVGEAEDDVVVLVDPPLQKKRKIHTVDLTNDSKPPIFIDLTRDDEGDASAVTTKSGSLMSVNDTDNSAKIQVEEMSKELAKEPQEESAIVEGTDIKGEVVKTEA